MKEDDYEQWQIEILNECFRILKDDGSVFYNHKNRLYGGEVYSPYKWLYKTKLMVHQEIVWDMGGSPIQAPIRWLPTTERIYWLTKGKQTKFHRNKDGEFKTEVWKIHRETRKNHPAPYPIKLVDTILDGFPNDERLIVLDPFCGSGTTCISAIKKGYDYIGFEKFQEYVDLAEERIKNFKENEK
jgi:modification methylase